MGRIVVVNFLSMDGVIQSPLSPDEDRAGGFSRGGWVSPYSDQTVEDFMRSATVGADGMLLGRRSYQILADAWSNADEGEAAVAAMNRIPKWVVSRSVDAGDLGWPNSHLIEGDVAAEVASVRDQVGGEVVVFGSGDLLHTLAHHDLVDEYRLLLFPVIIGPGKRMFGDRSRMVPFHLAGCTTSASGVVILTYTREGTSDQGQPVMSPDGRPASAGRAPTGDPARPGRKAS